MNIANTPKSYPILGAHIRAHLMPKFERPPMSLTNVKISTAKPREKAYKLTDEKGLDLQVNPNSSKYWRFKYRYASKEKKLAFGVYPDMSLADARDKRDAARKLVANDVDPGLNKQMMP